MGTRADFYVGAEWLGSVAFDGYQWEESPECPIMQAKTEDEYRTAVTNAFDGRDDVSLPEHGWPWPWNNSKTTDYAYRFEDGKTTAYCFGSPVEKDDEGEHKDTPERSNWPDMADKKNVTYGKRSGLIVLSC